MLRIRQRPAPLETTAPTALWMLISALGVVFGDIGTSPLYALRACFSEVAGVRVDTASVLGALSLLFWSLTLVISVKYVGIILRADNKGEGGVLSLATLVLNERRAPLSRRGDRIVAFAVFGAVFLAVTGGEALYTDLGHFGRAPIARAWYFFVWPCLLLNYFGQGALLLEQPRAVAHPFYMLAPGWFLIPLVILATIASVIASQAVISGVFSITQQCQQLGYLPRLKIMHSSEQAMGQVYVPTVNWLVCAATIALTLGFGSSERIAGAYGVGVSTTMLIDTLLILLLYFSYETRTARFLFAALCALAVVDVAFVLANLQKVPHGGWFALLFGTTVFGVMRTWQRGRETVTQRMRREEQTVEKFLAGLATRPPLRAPGTAVYLTSSTEAIPRTLVRNLKLNGILHERVILFTVSTERIPRVTAGQVAVKTIAPGCATGAACSSCFWPAIPNTPRRASAYRPRD